jgi:phosphate transport system substrate-binding protein
VKALHFILSLLLCALPCAAQTLVIKGSDTLGAKLVPQLKEEFRALHPETTFEIAAEGSSTGVAAIISSTADIGMSSRPVTQEEVSKARLNGVDMQMITVAFDGMALIVNEHNPVQSLSPAEVRGIFTGYLEDWAAVGGKPGRISVYTRNTASGTYRDFQDLAMKKDDYSPRSQKLAGNEQIASEVAENPNGIGYVGLAYANTPGVRVLSINGHLPTKESILSGDYPYARPTFYLVNANVRNDLAQQFIDFTLSPEGQAIVEAVHFIPAR